MKYYLDHLKELESESIFIMREVAAQFEHPVILFSGGKDSILMTYLAVKAFHPARVPFPLLHIDTGHNFPETLEYRDMLVEKYNLKLEKARAKERFFSHRDDFGQWDPKNQRPELWNLFNGKKHIGEHFRVFPISNWTELDVWQYLAMEEVDLPSLYFAHERKVFERDGILLADSEYIPRKETEEIFTETVRCRTIGDMTCTGVWRSTASNVEEIIAEVATSRLTERGGRADDKRSETAMEDRKKEGYF
jgi:sulfate adenylyltransferase subunit 2